MNLDSYIENDFKESWIYPPFSAHLAEDGKIYARGAQDMKSIGMQYLEAVRKLKANGTRLKRTLHISFVPGELWKYITTYFL